MQRHCRYRRQAVTGSQPNLIGIELQHALSSLMVEIFDIGFIQNNYDELKIVSIVHVIIFAFVQLIYLEDIFLPKNKSIVSNHHSPIHSGNGRNETEKQQNQ